MKPEDSITGSHVDLSGDKLEEFEEQLTSIVQYEISDCEEFLESEIRPRISENWEYYAKKLPKQRDGEASYVDNTCQATVDHYVAHCIDAFTSNDTLEIIPSENSNSVVNRVINAVVNDVLDSENDRYRIYHSFFMDAFVSGVSIFKPYIKESTRIEKKHFKGFSEEELNIMEADIESAFSDDYEELVRTVTNEYDETFEVMVDEFNSIELSKTSYDGYFTIITKEKTIKIEQVPAENFLINRDAKSIDDANFVGHKVMITLGSLLEMGFEYDKVKEVSERGGNSNDASDNIASSSRRSRVIGNTTTSTSLDASQEEVELFEVYVRTSIEETVGDDEAIAVAKLYQVFFSNDVLLACQEVDFIPYTGTSPNPTPHLFWGTGMVDLTKDIQKAKTGLHRQLFAYNELASKPRFQYVPGKLENPRDILNQRAGAGIAVKELGAISPIPIASLAGDNQGLMGMMDAQRETGTGMSFVGQGMLGEVLKAGGSTISAQMVLTEGQIVQKAVINTLLEGAIKPLIGKIYTLLRDNFDEWEITIDNELIKVNPNREWPRLREVRVKTPLGKGAKLEKAQTLMTLWQTLATGGEATKNMINPAAMRQLLVDAYTYQDIPDASSYLATVEEMQQKDVMMQQMQTMQQTLQQMQQQMQQIASENQTLKQISTKMAQQELDNSTREIAIKERDAEVRAQKAIADAMYKADKQNLDESKANVEAEKYADQQHLDEQEFELSEREFALKQQLAIEEARQESNKGM